jgi:hypothetical protein
MNTGIKAMLNLRYTLAVLALAVVVGLPACSKNPEEAASPPPAPAVAPTAAAPVAKPVIPAATMKLGMKPKDATNCPPNALVKGTMTKKRGNIYQTTKSPDYAQVKPDICFKDTATAEKAGFKVPK